MKKLSIALLLLSAVILIHACKKDLSKTSTVSSNVSLAMPDTVTKYYEKGTDEDINAMAMVGRVLFYDGRLSVNNSVSCASCHKQQLAFADNVQFSRGFENRLTGRNSPPIQNIIGNTPVIRKNMTISSSLFWDGREQSVNAFIARPVTNHIEMGMDDPNAVADKLAGLPYYADLFKKAYGDETITFERISECIAYFMCAIESSQDRFTQYTEGKSQLSALELQGLNLFIDKYNCASCHNLGHGYNGLPVFMNIGLDTDPKDKGRGGITRDAMDNGSFRIPSLSNVALTAPYMHDGRFKTLEHVLEHYSEGINDVPNLSDELKDAKGHAIKMHISEHEKKALIAFLNTFTDHKMITDPKFSNPFVVN